MKRLLLILLVAISTQAYSQVYTLRLISVSGNVIDSLYSKNGNEDTLWRHDNNIYNVAFTTTTGVTHVIVGPHPKPRH